jgi:hypothetical protein
MYLVFFAMLGLVVGSIISVPFIMYILNNDKKRGNIKCLKPRSSQLPYSRAS